GATKVKSCVPSLRRRSQPWSLSALMVKVWTVPSLSHSVLLLAVIRRCTTSLTFKVITGSFWPGILNRLSLSAITVISRDGPPAMASGDKMPSTNANRTASRIRFVLNTTHLSFHFDPPTVEQSGIQSDAGNAYFVPTRAKCLQTQIEMTLGGRVSGRAEVSLCKLPPRCGRSDRTVCVR